MNYRQPIVLIDLIELVKRRRDRNYSYCVYSKLDADEPTLDTVCYLDEHPQITENDEEVFSDFVGSNSLYLLYRDELLQDVVDSVLLQKADASPDQMLRAIIYYSNHDTFLQIV